MSNVSHKLFSILVKPLAHILNGTHYINMDLHINKYLLCILFSVFFFIYTNTDVKQTPLTTMLEMHLVKFPYMLT